MGFYSKSGKNVWNPVKNSNCYQLIIIINLVDTALVYLAGDCEAKCGPHHQSLKMIMLAVIKTLTQFR